MGLGRDRKSNEEQNQHHSGNKQTTNRHPRAGGDPESITTSGFPPARE